MAELYQRLAQGHFLVLDGIGILVAAALVLVLRVLLPAADRRRVRGPLLLLLLHLGLTVPRLMLEPGSLVDATLQLAALFVLLLSIGSAGFALVLDALLGRRRAQPWPKIFRDIFDGLVYIVAAFFTLQAAGVEPGSLLTTSALLTAVIGLSLQDTLGNLFAGLAIQVQHPFDVGDWIQYGENPKHSGRVVEINWRATKILNMDQFELIIPNGPLARGVLHNYSKPTPLIRRSMYLVVPFEVSPHRVHELALAGLSELEGVRSSPAPSVLTEAFNERGITYWVRFFIDDFAQREQVEAAVHDKIWYGLNRLGIDLAVPVARLSVNSVEASTAGALPAELRRKVLRDVDFLAGLPDEALAKLAEETRWSTYGPHETIVREGDTGHELFVVVKGTCGVRLGTGSAHAQEVARLGPGSFFGERAVLTGEPRSASVVALTGVELLVMDKLALSQVLERMPDLAERISSVVAERSSELERLGIGAEAHAGKSASADGGAPLLLSRIRGFFSLDRRE